MKGQTHGGKGSAPRPVDSEKFDNNFDAIFRKKEKVMSQSWDTAKQIIDIEAANTDAILRHRLIELGWTPPPEVQLELDLNIKEEAE